MKCLGYSPWGTGTHIGCFDQLFDTSKNCLKHGFENIDAFVLWGGTDIHPSFYNEKHSGYSGAPHLPSERDVFEWKALQYCKANGIPVIGVCRGAQLMCAFVGGKLIQHVSGHNQSHDVTTSDGQTFEVTSCHHQMLDLRGSEHELLGWSTEKLSKTYVNEDTALKDFYYYGEQFQEPEMVYFPMLKGIAIQGHPEWANPNSPFVQYCLDLVREYCFDEVWV